MCRGTISPPFLSKPILEKAIHRAAISAACRKEQCIRKPVSSLSMGKPCRTRSRPMVNFLITTAVMFLDAIIMFGLAVASVP